ncbi:MAG: cupredoxin domain-containing protein [Mycobacteriales bacterium]
MALVAVTALAGCGGGGSSDAGSKGGSTPAGGAVAGDAITIKDFLFKPMDLKVKVGQEITVTNEDRAPHTITADDKSFDSGDLQMGKTFTFKVDKAGTYSYICSIHQYMKGTLEVTP